MGSRAIVKDANGKVSRSVSISMGLELDEDKVRLVMNNGTCTCTSTDCSGPFECIAESFAGGCECASCSSTCTKTSSTVSSSVMFRFFS